MLRRLLPGAQRRVEPSMRFTATGAAARALSFRATRPSLGGAGGAASRKKRRAASAAAKCPPPATVKYGRARAPLPAAETQTAVAAAAPASERVGTAAPAPAPVASITVAVAEVLQEWATVMNVADDTAPAPAPHGTARKSGAASHEESTAERARALAVILRHPDRYPQLHTLFFLDSDSDTGVVRTASGRSASAEFELIVDGLDAVVRSENSLADLLSILRSYRQLSRQSAWMDRVSRQLGDSLLRELASAWEVACTQRSGCSAVKRSLALVLLEIHRSRLSQHQSQSKTRLRSSRKRSATNGSEGSTKKKAAVEGGGAWSASVIQQFLAGTVAAAVESIQNYSVEDGVPPLQELTADYVLLLLAESALHGAADTTSPAPAQPLQKQWSAAAAAANQRIESRLQSCIAIDPSGLPTADSKALLEDVLDALFVCQSFEMILPVAVKQATRRHAAAVAQRICRAVQQTPAIFYFLCSAATAARLERLRSSPGSLYEQLCTAVFSAASTFLEIEQAAVPALMAQAHSARRARDAAPRAPPPLHSALAQMCYLFMCAGLSPDAVLSSGLCMSLSAMDLVDITAAAALFSEEFAAAPLPPRIHSALVEEAVALCHKAHRGIQNSVQSSAELLLSAAAGRVPLLSRMENGLTASSAAEQRARTLNALPPRTPTTGMKRHKRFAKMKAQRASEAAQRSGVPGAQGSKTADATAGTAAAQPGAGLVLKADADALCGQAYCVATSALVESLCRGDVAVVTRVAQSLLPLLEADGAAAYLVESMELIAARVSERMAHAGVLGPRGGRAPAMGGVEAADCATQPHPSSVLTTTLAVEQSFVEVACAYQARLSECVLRRAATDGRPPAKAHAPVARRNSAESPPIERARESLALVLRFSACALTLGMRPSSHEQLTVLHATLRAACTAAAATTAGSAEQQESAAAVEAFGAVTQLDTLLTGLAARQLPVARHPQSMYVRSSSIAINSIVAVHLQSTRGVAAALAGNDSHTAAGEAVQRQREFILSVVHLLYRVSTGHPVETEPAQLRAYRTEILDPALASVLRASGSSDDDNELSMMTLAEVAVVMCVARTIHHVSSALYEGLARAVVHAVGASKSMSDSLASRLAQTLLCAAAVICLRADAALTALFVEMADALEQRLSARQAVAVLNASLLLQVPLSAAPVTRMLARLTAALMAAYGTPADGTGRRATTKRSARMPVSDTVEALCVLGRCDEAGGGATCAVPYGPVLRQLCSGDALHRRVPLGLQQCGGLVQVAASLRRRPEVLARCTEDERQAIVDAPRVLAVLVLQAPLQGAEHALPAVLVGYAGLESSPELRAQVLRAYISRTIRACPLLSPDEVVACVEAYCRAGLYHEYLFSVLLGRVADVTQRFSLELSLRLLRCGVEAAHPQVRMACRTAAQPVFVAHVRHVLQSDPRQIVNVGSTSTTILHCLRECFPHDPISASVLGNIAAHHHDAGMDVTKAALELLAARGSQDYNVLRTLADHCTTTLFPSCDAESLGELVLLLVLCGVRSSALMMAASARFNAVADTASGAALATLSTALVRACVEVEPTLLVAIVDCTTQHVDHYLDALDAEAGTKSSRQRSADALVAPTPPFTTEQAVAVLQLMRAASRQHHAVVVPAVDAILTYLGRMWDGEEHAEAPAAALSTSTSLFRSQSLTVTEVEALLGACVDLASKPSAHRGVAVACAERLRALLDAPAVNAAVGSEAPSDAAAPSLHSPAMSAASLSATPSGLWRTDLSLLVRLTGLLVRAFVSKDSGTLSRSTPVYPVMEGLLALLYDKRSALLTRHLLLDTVRQALVAAGSEAHPALYGLVVTNKLI